MRTYSRDMTDRLGPDLTPLIAELDAIDDPADRFQATVSTEAAFDEAMRGVRRRIAVQLYDGGKRPYREVGEIMGKVTAQRAEQIAKGR